MTISTRPLWTYLVSVIGFVALVVSSTRDHFPTAQAVEPSSVQLSTQATLEQQKALDRLGVSSWHDAHLRGRGVKVAILDTGFRGWQNYLGNVLPKSVTVRSFRKDGNLEARNSQHGILCAELIHAIAPDAELLFANWEPNHPYAFLRAVQWARDQGADIVSCSIIMPSWSDGEGGGPIHAKLATLLAHDTLFFAAAGNTAKRHWSGNFRPGDDGLHQWKPNLISNPLTPWGHQRVAVELYAPTQTKLRLEVLDEQNRSVGHATLDRTNAVRDDDDQYIHAGDSGGGSIVVRFNPKPNKKYHIQVSNQQAHASTEPAPFHVVLLGAHLGHSTRRGSIPFPGDGPSTLAIGAVDETESLLSYSSCGTDHKPDFVATVPFPSRWRKKPFRGTSAASPQAAGIAALIWARHPLWNATKVKARMRHFAKDLSSPGHDYQTGYGLLQLDTAPRTPKKPAQEAVSHR